MVINTLRNLDQTTDGVSDMTIPEQMPSFEDHIQRKDFSDKRRNFEKTARQFRYSRFHGSSIYSFRPDEEK